jgi:protein O-mannosyl-transferase
MDHQKKSPPGTVRSESSSVGWKHLPSLLIFAFAFLLYGNTLWHDYALDDSIVVSSNAYTKQGFSGLGKIFTTDAFEGFFGKKKNLVEGGGTGR